MTTHALKSEAVSAWFCVTALVTTIAVDRALRVGIGLHTVVDAILATLCLVRALHMRTETS